MRSLGVEFEDVNYAKQRLTPEQVLAVVRAAGSVAAVLNVRHAIAKERGWAAAPPPAEEFAAAVVQEPNLLRRPILLVGGQAIVGLNRTAYGKLVG
ncbi:MAG: ArsC/Spx/MgsR family protein [Kofleriaceae bacterium]